MYMVVLAQLAEHRIVVPSVVGSSPTFHPKQNSSLMVAVFVSLSVSWLRNNRALVAKNPS